MLYIPLVALCIFGLLLLIPKNCYLDGHEWILFMFYDEKRRRCRTCNKVQFWDLSVSDVIEQFTGEPNQGQWSSIKYSPYEKKN